jgi:hypothetical protein
MVHKRCHKFINLQCDQIMAQQHQSQQAALASANSNHSSISNGSSSSYPTLLSSSIVDAKHQQQQNKQQQQQHQKLSQNNGMKTSSPIHQESKTKSILTSSLKAPKFSSQAMALTNTDTSRLKKEQAPLEPKSNQDSLSTPVDGSGEMSQSKPIGLEKFDLIKVIGRGSYAKVFLVEYKKTKKCYAMKVIKKSICDDDEDIDWVQTEKHVFEQATNHPFLVGLHSCFQTESRLFFVIEYLCGGDLMYHMQKKRRLPEDHARFYSAEICIALGFLHSKGIIYRDLKLDNVLLDIEGHIKLTDYGNTLILIYI